MYDPLLSRTLVDEIMGEFRRFPFRCRFCQRRFYGATARAPIGMKAIARTVWRIVTHGLPAGPMSAPFLSCITLLSVVCSRLFR